MKFLHTADWQIGMKAAHVGPAAPAVRQRRLDAARRVVQIAAEHGAQLMLVAGDTFEDNAVEPLLVQKVADILAEFAGPVWLLPGNHDPASPGSVWDHPAWRSHGHLHVLYEARPVSLAGVTLYPSPLREKRSSQDPTRWIDARGDPNIALGLAHGAVEGAAAGEGDYPIARDAAARGGLDYLALGHWHSTAMYADDAGAIRMAYAGSHEPTKFGERDSGNVLVVEIAAKGEPPRIESVRSGGLQWRALEREIREPGDLSPLLSDLQRWGDPGTTLLSLRLQGVLHPGDCPELERIEQVVQSRFLYGHIDAARLLPRAEDDSWMANLPPGVLREVASQLQQLSRTDAPGPRPDWATPEVAARALVELYALIHEAPP